MATVLVVDDRETNRRLVRTLLVYRGHRVVEASDGIDGLALARKELPNLVITDVVMPGMDGYELVSELRADPTTAAIAVVFYTANYLEHEVRPIARVCGVSHVVAKSSVPEVLLAVIDSVLDNPSETGVQAPAPTFIPDEFAREHLRILNAKLVEKISELELKEFALHESEERFRGITESSPIGIVLVTNDAHAVYVNPRLVEMMDTSSQDLLGEGWLSRMVSEHGDDVSAAIRGGNPDPEHRYRTSTMHSDGQLNGQLNGAKRWFNIQIRTLRAAAGQSVGAVCTVDDVTRAVEAEDRNRELDARLRVTERLESLGLLAGGIAHDFNNILTALLGYTDLSRSTLVEAMESQDLDDVVGNRVVRYLDRVLSAGDRAVNLTGQLLAFGRSDIVAPSVINLNGIVFEVTELLGRTIGEHIEIVTVQDPDLRFVKVDAGQLSQVVFNLAINARDAMADGGTLTIETRNSQDSPGAVHRAGPPLPTGYVRLTVTDTGCGMSPEVIARVFEPFFTTKPTGEGTGLGLATSHGIVQRAGGEIVIESAPGAGTVIDLYLPAVDEIVDSVELEPVGNISNMAGMAGINETILVAEDELDIREIASLTLTNAGYKVLTAFDGRDAIEVANQYPERIDLLLTDVVMPRMLGRELSEQVKHSRPGMPTLFMSGYAATLMSDGFLDPAMTVLAKPFSTNDLLFAVRTMLDTAPIHG